MVRPASRPALDPLRDPFTGSGFQCVYRLSDSGRYRARVEKRLNLGTYPSAPAAAAAVAAYYAALYGPRWPGVFRHRLANPWKVRPAPDRGAGPRAHVVDLYVRGVPVRLTRGDVDPRCPRARRADDVWPSRGAARRALRAYLRRHVPLWMDDKNALRVWLWRA